MKIVAIKIGPLLFSPNVLPLMATIVLVSIFAGLGRWQLDRMYEREVIEAQRLSNATQSQQLLPSTKEGVEQWRYAPILLKGVWLPDKQFLLDNQVRKKQAGYNVLTPFRLDDQRIVLVDRGWVPLVNGARDELPDIAFTAQGAQSISGTLYTPFEKMTLDPKFFQANGWPAVIATLDFQFIGSLLGVTLEPLTLRMDPDQPHGYSRQWPAPPFPPERHLSYAVQWFSLALAVLVLFIALNTKRRDS